MRRSCALITFLSSLALLAGCAGAAPQSAAPTAAPPTSAPVPTRPSAMVQPAPTTQAPAAAQPSATDPPAAPANGQVELRQILSGLRRPVQVTHAGDGSGRLFIVEKAGTIAIVRESAVVPARFLDITDRVGSSGSEQGLLSVAFHPRFAQNGYLFVNYTSRDGDTVVSRFSSSGDTADPASEKRLLGIDQPYPNHNGGLSLFGPDGYLYIGTGDGGSAGDPQNHAQDPTSLLGKMLRIDVDTGDPYAIPPDNPQIDGRRSEIWATGLRNPWRFSFDRQTGDLYIADVGQNRFEEIDLQPAGSRGGENYGWRPLEGNECFRGACDPSAYVAPIYAYSHDDGCSVTGGHVYRGAAIASLQGAYVFGDYCSGRIWSLRQAPSGEWQRADLIDSRLSISSFGEDEAGELFLVDLRSGGLYQFVAQP